MGHLSNLEHSDDDNRHDSDDNHLNHDRDHRSAAGPAHAHTAACASRNCDPSYPTVCIRPPPPDLDCGDVPYKSFRSLQPDPHRFDGNKDGYGCEG